MSDTYTEFNPTRASAVARSGSSRVSSDEATVAQRTHARLSQAMMHLAEVAERAERVLAPYGVSSSEISAIKERDPSTRAPQPDYFESLAEDLSAIERDTRRIEKVLNDTGL